MTGGLLHETQDDAAREGGDSYSLLVIASSPIVDSVSELDDCSRNGLVGRFIGVLRVLKAKQSRHCLCWVDST